jgi:hypothetical protein
VSRVSGIGYRVPDARRLLGRLRAVAGVALVLVALTAPARGQEPTPETTDCSKPGAVCGPPLEAVTSTFVVHEYRFEISVLGGIFGGGDLGDGKATMLTNDVPTSEETSLFSTSARIDGAPAIEGRLGVRLGRGFWVEGGLGYARPTFAVDISADVEGAPAVTASSKLTQVVADVALQHRWHGLRFRPFVMGGAGYLRHLDEPRTTAETGWLAYGGGGVLMRVAPTSVGFWRHVALRGDVRVAWPRDAMILSEQRTPTFTAVGGIVIGHGGRVEERP